MAKPSCFRIRSTAGYERGRQETSHLVSFRSLFLAPPDLSGIASKASPPLVPWTQEGPDASYRSPNIPTSIAELPLRVWPHQTTPLLCTILPAPGPQSSALATIAVIKTKVTFFNPLKDLQNCFLLIFCSWLLLMSC